MCCVVIIHNSCHLPLETASIKDLNNKQLLRKQSGVIKLVDRAVIQGSRNDSPHGLSVAEGPHGTERLDNKIVQEFNVVNVK